MAKSIPRCAAPGILLAILCLAPFLNKAFTIDDPLFLLDAKQVLSTPLTPTAVELCWDNIGYPRPMRALGPPAIAMAYALVPVVLLESREWIAHLLQLAFLCAAILATVSLALRCASNPRQAMLAGLIFASFPVVLAMTGTVMPDILATMLGVIGLDRTLAWKQDARFSQALAAGLALGLAPLARSHTLLLWPIAILLLVDFPAIRQTKLIRFIPLLIAAIALAGIDWITSGDADLSTSLLPNGPNAEQISWSLGLLNFLGFGMNWTLATPLAIAMLLLDGAAGVTLGGVAILCGGLIKFLIPASPMMLDVGACLGFFAVLAVIASALRSRAIVRIALALTLLIAIPMVVFAHLPPKYLAPCAPAAAILLAWRISETGRRTGIWITAIVGFGVVTGCAILQADAEFAGLARYAVAQGVVPRIQAGHHAWYSGPWALTWYGEQAGARCLCNHPPFPEAGDVIIAGEIEGGRPLAEMLPLQLRLVNKYSSDRPGVRIMNPAARAGFYSNWFGYLPWRWSREPVNTYYVWEVE